MSERTRQVWMGLGVTLLSGAGYRDTMPVTPPPRLAAVAVPRRRV